MTDQTGGAGVECVVLTSADVMVRVIRLRNELGSAKALAEKLGCSESYLSDMTHGRRAFSDELMYLVGVDRQTRYLAMTGWKP